MESYIIVGIIASILVFVFKYGNRTDIPKVKGLPELPGVPFFGSLIMLGKHHARNCAKLANHYGGVFQVRLGNRRIIYANTFDSVKDLWIKNQTALISRPKFWTFHDVVSETQGVFTLGTSPWNESAKRARKAAATALNRQATQQYLPFIDLESTASIRDLLKDIPNDYELDPNGYFQRFSLNISLTLNFGIRIQGDIHDQTLNDVIATERELGNIRGVAHCWQDYIPILRLFPGTKRKALAARAKRDVYILSFYNQMMERINAGTDNPCIAGNVIKDPEAKLSERK